MAHNFPEIDDQVWQRIAGVICYINDIFVSSEDETIHLKTLEEVLTCLENKDGKVPHFEANANAPTPTNVQQVCSFSGC